ncbi:MAG: hypothetical protein J5640_00635 [Bacteroidales bacterium]|nr:hypothetical protein [Bacteroidales bacterium]
MKRTVTFICLALALLGCRQAEEPNFNGIWLWSKFMPEVNLDTLAAKDIKNIILHEVSFERHGVDSTLEFVSQAHKRGMKVHIWFQAFYQNGKWMNPVDDSLNRYKQEYFDEVIERAVRYVGYGVDGIHLDYIRFGGTAWKHNPSEEITATGCVTEFCRQISEATKAANPDIILSAALMPEPDSEYYYGQDPAQMGQYIDILMPMIYFHCDSYRKGGRPWAQMVADHFATKGAPARVWAGLTTYVDTDTTKVVPMDAESILRDCRMFIDSTMAEGVVLFRYGLGDLPDLHELKK